jgi:hypothetical protein
MPTRRRAVALDPSAHTLTFASLLEHLASAAVSELVIVQVQPGLYTLHAALSWRGGRSVLVSALGAPRTWRSLDTLASFLRTSGTGSTLIRLELQP